jgi:DNA polymerase III subunit beta
MLKVQSMEIKVYGEYLIESISEAARIAGGTRLHEADRVVMIEAHEEPLSVSAGSGDRFVVFELPLKGGKGKIDIQAYGKLAADGRVLAEVIKKMPGRLSIRTETPKKILITSLEEHISAKIACYSAGQVPNIVQSGFPFIYTMDAADLAAGLKYTAASAAKTSSRPILEGVNLTFDSSGLTFTATDSSRLAMWRVEGAAGFNRSVTLPARSASELLKLIGKSPKGQASISLSDSQAAFSTSSVRFYSTLLSGRFPSAEKLKPEGCKTELILNKNLLLKGVDRAVLFAGEKSSPLVSILVKDENYISLSSPLTEMGSIEEVQSLHSFKGETGTAAIINGCYLADALKGADSEYIKIKLFGTMKPILISSPDKGDYFHLISPVRTASGMFLAPMETESLK